MQSCISGGIFSLVLDTSFWPTTSSQSCNVCNQDNFFDLNLMLHIKPGGRKDQLLQKHILRYLIYVISTIRSTFQKYIRVVNGGSIVCSNQKKSQCQWMIKFYNLRTKYKKFLKVDVHKNKEIFSSCILLVSLIRTASFSTIKLMVFLQYHHTSILWVSR